MVLSVTSLACFLLGSGVDFGLEVLVGDAVLAAVLVGDADFLGVAVGFGVGLGVGVGVGLVPCATMRFCAGSITSSLTTVRSVSTPSTVTTRSVTSLTPSLPCLTISSVPMYRSSSS